MSTQTLIPRAVDAPLAGLECTRLLPEPALETSAIGPELVPEDQHDLEALAGVER